MRTVYFTISSATAVGAALLTMLSFAHAEGPNYAFCNNRTYASSIDGQLRSRGYDSLEVSKEVAKGACELSRAKEEKRRKIQSHIAQWKRYNGFTDAEARIFFALLIDQRMLAREKKAFCEGFASKNETELPAERIAYRNAMGSVAGCRYPNRGKRATELFYDWPTFDPLARAVDVARCYHVLHRKTVGGSRIDDAQSMLGYARCEARARHTDIAAALALAHANTSLNVLGKSLIIMRLQGLIRERQILVQAFRPLSARSAAYRAVLETKPEAAYRQWLSVYRDNRQVMDEARYLIENGHNPLLLARKKGCAKAMFARLRNVARSAKATTFEELPKALSGPLHSMLLSAYAYCELAAGRSEVASEFTQRAASFMLSLGPGEAAYKAAADELVRNREAIAEAKGASIGMLTHSYPRWGAGGHPVAGIVKAIAKKGETAVIHFKKEEWLEPMWDCVDTNRIDRIDPSGKVVYRQNCKRAGTKKMSIQERPITVQTAHLAGIRPGRFARVTRNPDGKLGIPLDVYNNKKRKVLLSALGLTFKR